MTRIVAFAVTATVAVLLMVLLGGAPSAAYPDKVIRCAVCKRAVQHVWEKARELRHHCRYDGSDRRCDYTGIHPHAIDQMIWGVCDVLPKSYQAIHESEFDIVLAEDPKHSDKVAAAIKHSCMRWLHTYHGVEKVGRLVHDNLRVGKGDNVLASMKDHFCEEACRTSMTPVEYAAAQEKQAVTDL